MLLALIYTSAIVAANLLVAWQGPWFSPVIAFFLIGLDLSLRDRMHEAWQGKQFWPRILGMIVGASAISYLLNPAAGQIGIASVAAFGGAALVDTLIYQYFIKRGWIFKANASNAGGAMADSLLFPTIAFGSLMPGIILMQFVAKVAGGFVWSLIIKPKTPAQEPVAFDEAW